MTYEEAMDRVQDEMAGMMAGDPAAQIGEWVTELLRQAPELAEGMDAGKTILGAYKALEDEARRKRKGSACVCIGPTEAEKLVRKYFGFGEMPGRAAGGNPPKTSSVSPAGCHLPQRGRQGESGTKGPSPCAEGESGTKGPSPRADGMDMLDALMEGL